MYLYIDWDSVALIDYSLSPVNKGTGTLEKTIYAIYSGGEIKG